MKNLRKALQVVSLKSGGTSSPPLEGVWESGAAGSARLPGSAKWLAFMLALVASWLLRRRGIHLFPAPAPAMLAQQLGLPKFYVTVLKVISRTNRS